MWIRRHHRKVREHASKAKTRQMRAHWLINWKLGGDVVRTRRWKGEGVGGGMGGGGGRGGGTGEHDNG